MLRAIQYTVLFIAAVILQVFLCNNLELGVYIHPMLFVVFILMLPMTLSPFWTLTAGLAVGLAMDFLTGGAGLYTIASVATAYARPVILRAVVGRENLHEGGVPCSRELGKGKFLKYALLLVLLFCTLFFFFEALTWKYYYLTLIRIVLSTLVTVILAFFVQLPLFGRSAPSK